MRYLCIIHDLEDNFRVTGFDTKKDNEIFDASKYLEVDEDSFYKLKEISKENSISYPKDNSSFDMSKIIVTKEDSLQLHKYSSKMKAISSFKEKFSEMDTFLFLKYFCLSIELSDKGYFIHKNNMSTILEKIKLENNESLLQKATDLCEIIDEIESKMTTYTNLTDTLKKINSSSKVERIDGLLEDYLSMCSTQKNT